MGNEITLRDIHERMLVLENILGSMTSYYSQAVSKTLITKEEIQSLKEILQKIKEEPKIIKKANKIVNNEVKKKNVRRKKQI